MCLEIYSDEGFVTPDTDVAWKIISYYKNRWTTPTRGYPVDIKSGRLSANTFDRAIHHTKEINGGAIHCWRTQELAKRNSYTCDIVLKVKGIHHIAHNEEEIAYEEIEWKQRNWWWAKTKILFNRYLPNRYR